MSIAVTLGLCVLSIMGCPKAENSAVSNRDSQGVAAAAARPTATEGILVGSTGPLGEPAEQEEPVGGGSHPRISYTVPAGESIRIRCLRRAVNARIGISRGTSKTRWYDRSPTPEGVEEVAWLNTTGGPERVVVEAEPSWPTEPAGHIKFSVEMGVPRANDLKRIAGFQALEDAYTAKGPPTRAVALKTAKEVFQKLGDRRWEAYAIDQLGRVDKHLKRRAEGLQKRVRALEIRREIGDRGGQMVSLNGIGNIHFYLGNHAEALKAWGDARYLAREIGDVEGEAMTIGNLGTAARDRGEYSEAMRLVLRSLALHRRLHDRRGEARSLAELGGLQVGGGDLLGATESFESALKLNRANGFRSRESEVLARLATLAVGRRPPNLGLALTLAQKSLAVRRSIAFASDREPFHFSLLGRIHRLRGDGAKAVELYIRALKGHRKNRSPAGEAEALEGLGLALAQRTGGQVAGPDALGPLYDEAISNIQASAALYKRLSMVREEAQSQTALSEVALAAATAKASGGLSYLTVASQAADRAVTLVETARAHLADEHLRGTYVGRARDAYDIQMRVSLRRFEATGRPEDQAAAFRAMERGRARTILERFRAESAIAPLAGANSPMARRLRERSLDIQADVRAAERQIGESLSRADKPAEALARDALVGALGRLAVVRREQFSLSPTWTKLAAGPDVSLAEVQSMLPQQHRLVEFSVGKGHAVAWVIERERVRVVKLPPRQVWRTMVEAANGATREPMTPSANTSVVPELQTLSDALLGVLSSGLDSRAGLTVVADGPLYRVPWAALPALYGRALSLSPSAAVLMEIHRRRAAVPIGPSSSIAVFDDPVFDAGDERVRKSNAPSAVGASPWRRLRFSAREAKGVLAVFDAQERQVRATGFDATRVAAIERVLQGHQVVHFATHASVDGRRPSLSGLVFSQVDRRGKPTPGMLRLYDIYPLKIQADLVTLSACGTDDGLVLDGEGVVGLARGFLSAGARRVLASQWKVHDRATAELMRSFYQGLVARRLSPAAALARAQQHMRESRRWAAPFYWAAFVLQGVGWQ